MVFGFFGFFVEEWNAEEEGWIREVCGGCGGGVGWELCSSISNFQFNLLRFFARVNVNAFWVP